MEEERPCIQAARWVVALGRFTTALFAVGAIGSSLATWATWSLGPLVQTGVFVGAAAGWHALLTAFDRHRRAAWLALLAWSATGAVGRVGGWLAGADVGVVALVGGLLDLVVAGLLLHPDSREWVARPRVAAPDRAGAGLPARGSDAP